MLTIKAFSGYGVNDNKVRIFKVKNIPEFLVKFQDYLKKLKLNKDVKLSEDATKVAKLISFGSSLIRINDINNYHKDEEDYIPKELYSYSEEVYNFISYLNKIDPINFPFEEESKNEELVDPEISAFKEKYYDFFEQIEQYIKKGSGYSLTNTPFYTVVKGDDNQFYTEIHYNNMFHIKLYNVLIPDNVKFYKCNVHIINYKEDMLPNNLYIEQSLESSNESGTLNYPIPKRVSTNRNNLVVGKDLIIYKDSGLRKLSNNTFVGNNLSVYNDMEKLPDNLRVGNNVRISDSGVKEIGVNTYISGTLIANNSKLVKLSEGIKAHKVDIANTKVTKLPLSLAHNCSKIVINDLIIENIKEFKKEIKNSPVKILIYTNRIKNKNGLKDINELYLDSADEEIILNPTQECCSTIKTFAKNILLMNSDSDVKKDLLLNKIEHLTPLKISAVLEKEKNNKEVVSNKKHYKLINYCQSKQAMDLLDKCGYEFTKEELMEITSLEVRYYYTYILIKKGLLN